MSQLRRSPSAKKSTSSFRLLRERGRATFRSMLMGARSRLEIVVTFLAMLELIKRHHIQARQDTVFGEIEVEPAVDWDGSDEFDLEFGE